MNKIKHTSIEIHFLLGLGVWREKYNMDCHGMDGEFWNIIFLCFKVQTGHFLVAKNL